MHNNFQISRFVFLSFIRCKSDQLLLWKSPFFISSNLDQSNLLYRKLFDINFHEMDEMWKYFSLMSNEINYLDKFNFKIILRV